MHQRRGSGRYHQLAMGRVRRRRRCAAAGVCAHGRLAVPEGLHLVVAWLPTLEKEMDVLDAHGLPFPHIRAPTNSRRRSSRGA